MIEYKYLRPKKADHLRKWHEEGIEKIDELKCDSYSNAVILPVRKQIDDGMLFWRKGEFTNGTAYSRYRMCVNDLIECHLNAVACPSSKLTAFHRKQVVHRLIQGSA